MPKVTDGRISERGAVLPAAIVTVMVVLLFLTAAFGTTVRAMHQSSRDSNVKRALAAADAGVDIAVDRLNRSQADSNQCPAASGSVVSAQPMVGAIWCPIATGTVDDGAGFSYAIKRGVPEADSGDCDNGSLNRTIVAVGDANGVTRTIRVNAADLAGPMLTCGVVGLDKVTVNDNALIEGDVGSNGPLNFNNYSRLEGDGTGGPSCITSAGVNNCQGTNSTITRQWRPLNVDTPFALRPILVPPATNDNVRLDRTTGAGSCLAPQDCDLIVGNKSEVNWNATTRVLTVSGTTELHLSGADYKLCQVRLRDDAKLVIPSPSNGVRLWIDTSTNDPSCPSGITNHVSIVENAVIDNMNKTADGHGDPTKLIIYGLGEDPGTGPAPLLAFRDQVAYDNTTSYVWPMVVYAPAWNVRVTQNVTIWGAVAAKDVWLGDWARIRWDDDVLTIGSPTPGSYVRRSGGWHECRQVGSTTSFDDSTCS